MDANLMQGFLSANLIAIAKKPGFAAAAATSGTHLSLILP
jgi:hypothetical protein